MRIVVKFIDAEGRIHDDVSEAQKRLLALRLTEAALRCAYPALEIPLEAPNEPPAVPVEAP